MPSQVGTRSFAVVGHALPCWKVKEEDSALESGVGCWKKHVPDTVRSSASSLITQVAILKASTPLSTK